MVIDRPFVRRTAIQLATAALVAASVSCGGPEPGAGIAPGDDEPLALVNEELLTNVTRDGVTVSVIPAEDAVIRAAYREAGKSGRWQRTEPVGSAEGELAAVRIDRLQPGRAYRYRLELQRAGAPEAEWQSREEHRFTTLRPAGEDVRVAFVTDSHIYGKWTKAQCGGAPAAWERGVHTLDLLAEREADLLVVGGDEACTSTRKTLPCSVDGEELVAGPVRSFHQAALRYRVMRRYYERVGHSLPFFYTLGNHDGEAGWIDQSRFFPETARSSRRARLASLPHPGTTYAAGEAGTYLAWESGDVQMVVLDVMGFTESEPQGPDEWTLGREQLCWLDEQLSRSERFWKALFIHHLVGGTTDYGRGSLRPAVDPDGDGSYQLGSLTDSFAGEQACVHCLMKKHGAQLLLHGHDHVFAFGEKLDANGDPEGIFYVSGGTPSGRPGSRWKQGDFQDFYDWAQHPRYDGVGDYERSDYDLDGDGTPERTGVVDNGFWEITFRGSRQVELRMLRADAHFPRVDGVKVEHVKRAEEINRPRPDLVCGPAQGCPADFSHGCGR